MVSKCVLLALIAAPFTSALAQNAPGVGFQIFEDQKPNLVCFEVKNAAGEDSPVLVMSSIDGTRNYEGVFMTGDCLNFSGEKNVVLQGFFVADPVTVRVGPTRNALK